MPLTLRRSIERDGGADQDSDAGTKSSERKSRVNLEELPVIWGACQCCQGGDEKVCSETDTDLVKVVA